MRRNNIPAFFIINNYPRMGNKFKSLPDATGYDRLEKKYCKHFQKDMEIVMSHIGKNTVRLLRNWA